MKQKEILTLVFSSFLLLSVGVNESVVADTNNQYVQEHLILDSDIYIIQDSDTLSNISRPLNVSTNRLQQFKVLKKGYKIPVGETIYWWTDYLLMKK